MAKTYHIITFGCQMNERDSETLAGMLETDGFVKTEEKEKADVVILNTCSVRENADKKFFGVLGQLKHPKEDDPTKTVCVCGCMMQQQHVIDTLKQKYPWVDLVFGTHNISDFPKLLHGVRETNSKVVEVWEDGRAIAEGLPAAREYPFKAFVNIMYGCNNFCTYCIVPYVRGRERSRIFETVVDECARHAANGVREICLLGQNVNSYGRDLYGSPRFSDLIRAVGETGIERLRFTSSNPKDLNDDVIAAMAETPCVMPHLHLAVQSGSSRILKAMNRSYTREQYIELVGRLRAAMPDIALTTDVIVGFPGETEEDFLETMSLFEEVRFSGAFTFIYSKRPGTPAAKIVDKTPPEVIQERFERLAHLVEDLSWTANQADLGKRVEVLIESTSKRADDIMVGHSEKNQTVHFPLPSGMSAEGLVGRIATIEVDRARTWYLSGTMVGDAR